MRGEMGVRAGRERKVPAARIEKPTRVWPDTHTSGPTHGPGRSLLLRASERARLACMRVCESVYICRRHLTRSRARTRTNAHRKTIPDVIASDLRSSYGGDDEATTITASTSTLCYNNIALCASCTHMYIVYIYLRRVYESASSVATPRISPPRVYLFERKKLLCCVNNRT